MTQQDAERLAIKLGLSTWDQGDDGFGGEDVPNKKAVELLMQYDLAAAASPQAPATQGIPGDILEHEYRHEHGLLAPGECQTHHCVGTFWTEQEIAVIEKLSKKQELSHVAVLRGALRNY